MPSSPLLVTLLTLPVAGCFLITEPLDNVVHYDAGIPADAFIPNYSCLGVPTPSNADDPVTMSGTIYHKGLPGITEDENIAGALITGYAEGGTTGTTRSADDGSFTLTATTDGSPLVGHLAIDDVHGHFTTMVYSPWPVTSDVSGLLIPMATAADLDTLVNEALIQQRDDAAIVAIEVTDCDSFPLAGAIVSLDPAPGLIIYNDFFGFPDLDKAVTGPDGIAYVLNAPIGEVTVAAAVGTTILRSHAITTTAIATETLVVSQISP